MCAYELQRIQAVGDGTQMVAVPGLLTDLQLIMSSEQRKSFGSAKPILKAISNLQFGRIPGRTQIEEQAMTSFPHEGLIMSAHGRLSPTAFVVASNNSKISIRVGESHGADQNLARSLSHSLGVTMGTSPEIEENLLLQLQYNCLTLSPVFDPKAPLSKSENKSLEVMFKAMVETPFIYMVFATPEPTENIREAIAFLNASAQNMDRTNLKIGQQQGIDRSARFTSDYIDKQLIRLQQGLQQGLWRTSILIGCQEIGQTQFASGVAAGSVKSISGGKLIVKNHKCIAEQVTPMINVNCLTSEELSMLWMLPLQDRSGFYVKKSVPFDIDHPEIKDGLELGSIKSDESVTKNKFKVSPDSLTHHTLVCGHTGSGKSSTIRHMLCQLSQSNIPFLVLEPAKSEYGILQKNIPDLTLLRAGSVPEENELPFLLNPFVFPTGTQLSTHIDLLRQCFVASFGLTPPAPYLLESALYRAYKKRGWNTDLGTHPNGRDRLSFPTLKDLLNQIDDVVEEANYDNEITRNLKGALKTRIGNLCLGTKGIALDTRDELPNELLYNSSVVLELRHLGSDQEKALVMGLVLTRLYELRETSGSVSSTDKLSHLLVIEEAHRLLKRAETQSAEFGNMAQQAVESFVNQLAEVRAYGQGVLVAEQIPSKLATEVVKQSGLKIVHRLLPAEDRNLVGDAMILKKGQAEKLALLQVGEAVIHGENMDGAVLVKVPNPKMYEKQSDKKMAGVKSSKMSAKLKQLTRNAVERLSVKQYLDEPVIFRAADAAILGLISGMNFCDAIEPLRIQIKESLEQNGQRDKTDSALIERLSFDAALERRALQYILPQSVLEEWLNTKNQNPDCLGGKIQKSLTRNVGPHAWCKACPKKCTVAYEGALIAKGERFRYDLDKAIDSPADDLPELMEKAAVYEIERQYSPENVSDALIYCAIGRVLETWGVSNKRVINLLQEILDITNNKINTEEKL